MEALLILITLFIAVVVIFLMSLFKVASMADDMSERCMQEEMKKNKR